ncbi:TonB family protein [Hymenobacter sp. GOD-10R]|uniref:TonB family protein n=1 Tax=Hymenobacter sp. GOD-10R TaxID=3093922 RepID=UPI002D76ECBE|nr:TonB family protein [Hymenobacter sp. GOD-10R]WRQ29638.1 TonB family protein [Hymenobacter sp. GOD-10R]
MLLGVTPRASYAQSLPAVYLNARNQATVPDSATHYRVVDQKEEAGGHVMREYSLAGTLLLQGTLSAIDPAVRNGLFTWFHPNGAKASQVHYHDDVANGLYLAWYEDGRVSQRGEYANGRRTGRWLSVHRNGQKRSEGHYLVGRQHGEWHYYFNTGQLSAVERLNQGRSLNLALYQADGSPSLAAGQRRRAPEFPGGEAALLSYLARNTVYPKTDRQRNITGSVYVTYTVGEDGQVGQVHVVRGLSPEADSEARRVVASLPAFRPGSEYNVPTAMTYTLPIHFAPSFTLLHGIRPAQEPPTEARAGYPDDGL